MEYIFLLNPYNQIGLDILQQYSGSNKHFILPIAFDWDIEYVKLFDKIDIEKTYLTIGLGSGARLLEEHLNPIKKINLIFIQNIPSNLNMNSYSDYHSNHFYQLRILTELSKGLNTDITYFRPKRLYLDQILSKHRQLLIKMGYLISTTVSYFKSIDTYAEIKIHKYFQEENKIQFLDHNSNIQ
jgi:hypothetical protein